MLFNSYIFLFLFLPAALLGYFFLNHYGKYVFAEYFLILMSLWFYAYFNISYLPIIVCSMILNYILARFMVRQSDRKIKFIFLIVGCVSNIGILFYYKYMGFFIENLNLLFKTNFNITNILLPLGISFFTFQQLSYVIDNYKNEIEGYSFRQYALFVCFFPQLIAGPIVLHNETIPQFDNLCKKNFNWDNFAVGLMAFSFGMAKKVLIADSFGNVANWGFSNVDGLGATNAFFVMLAYTIQIYFDFSGYCDMAIGIAKMFNIDLPMNFDSPYKSLSVTEFWKKWHITLTRFLRTYVYFPLGGSRKGQARTYMNLFIVFLISGIWHGASYTFIIWGVLHGLMMIFERLFKDRIKKLHPALAWLIMFIFINFAWIIFRANSINDAISLIKQILLFQFTPLSNNIFYSFNCVGFNFILPYLGYIGSYLQMVYPVLLFIGAILIILFCKNTNERMRGFKPTIGNALISAIILLCSIISLSGVSTFLYFNF